MMELKSYSAKTNQGPYLQINEDDVEIDILNKLFLIFDGFGGSGVGDKAVSILKGTVKNFYTRFGGDPDSTFPFFYSHKYLLEGNALINAMHFAHKAIKEENADKEMHSKGGASAIGASFSENVVTLVSTGNCRGYFYRKGKLSDIIMPDCLFDLGRDNYESSNYSVPTSGFGLFDDIHFQVKEVRPGNGDCIILMTDGVYSRLGNDEIKFILEKSDEPDASKIDELFKLSNERGNVDNQSTILLRF